MIVIVLLNRTVRRSWVATVIVAFFRIRVNLAIAKRFGRLSGTKERLV
jgi:hypothetical protein